MRLGRGGDDRDIMGFEIMMLMRRIAVLAFVIFGGLGFELISQIFFR